MHVDEFDLDDEISNLPYSEELKLVLMRMLQHDEMQRPDFIQLIAEIRKVDVECFSCINLVTVEKEERIARQEFYYNLSKS